MWIKRFHWLSQQQGPYKDSEEILETKISF